MILIHQSTTFLLSKATAYDCPDTGQTYILVINEGLYFGTSMSHSLINPNLRHFGTIVQDNPYSNDNITYIDTNIPDNDKRLYIPLTSEGINILFETWVPTQQELDDCPYVNLTSDTEWNPKSKVTLMQVKYAPKLYANLFSVT